MPNHVKNIVIISGPIDAVDKIVNTITTTEVDEQGVRTTCVDLNTLIPMPESLNVVSGGPSDQCLKIYLSDIYNDKNREGELISHISILKKYNDKQDWGYKKVDYHDLYKDKELEEAIEQTIKQHSKPCEIDSMSPVFKTREDVIAYGKRVYDNIKTYGVKDWYDWRTYDDPSDPNNDDIGWSTKWNTYSNSMVSKTTGQEKEVSLVFQTAWNIPFKFYKKLYKLIHAEPDPVKCNIVFADEDPGSAMGIIKDIIDDRIDFVNIEAEFDEDKEEYCGNAMGFYDSVWSFNCGCDE